MRCGWVGDIMETLLMVTAPSEGNGQEEPVVPGRRPT